MTGSFFRALYLAEKLKKKSLPGVDYCIRRFLVLCIPLFHISLQLQAQLPTTCPNSNFSLGTFENWTGCYGTFNNPCATPGFDTAGTPPLHSLIPAPGFQDPNACDMLTTVFPGEAYSARLGHETGGQHAAQLKYDIPVTAQNYLFIYRYAIVLQDPNHSPGQQPSFTIEVQDIGGVVLDSTCGYYYVYAQPNLPEWKSCALPGTDTEWKDWTTVGMDLTPYVGKTIRIVFTIRDCSLGGHYGYAYISAYCDYLQMQVALCAGDSSATLTAPPGFFYDWWTVNGDTTINGDTTQSILIPQPETGDEYFCKLTAYNGCEVTISQVLSYTVIQANFTHSEGCVNIPVNFTDSSIINQNQVVDWKWDFGDGTPVVTGIQNPVHSFSTPGTYNVQLVSFSTEGCTDTIIKPVTVTLLPFLANATLRKEICTNNTVNVSLIPGVPGTAFTWTASASSPAITGYNNNATPSTFLNDLLVNSGTQADSVMYTLTPQTAGCTGQDTLFTVIVYPAPILTNSPLSASICDSSFTGIDLLSNLDTTRFTWTVIPSGGNITGYSDNTTNPTIWLNQQLFLAGNTPESLIYQIIPHAYGCDGPESDFTVTVNPYPVITNTPMRDSICDLTSPAISLQSTCAGATFAWTAQLGYGNVTGFSNGSGPVIDQVLNNQLTTPGEVRYHVAPTAYGCTGSDTTFYILVNPSVTLTNNPPAGAICSGETTAILLTASSGPAGFIWTCTPGSPNLSGFSNNNIPTDSIIQTVFNSGTVAATVTYHITPVFDGCYGDTTDFILTVKPIPDVMTNPPSSVVCDSARTMISLSGSVAGTQFSWTATGSSPAISGFGPGSGNQIRQRLFNSGYVPGSVTYQVVPAANGCTGSQATAAVTVNPRPEVTLLPCFDTVTIVNAQPVRLKGGTPLSGTFSGTGVSGQQFLPSVTGLGRHRITYTYINNYGCSDAASLFIQVVTPGLPACGNNITDVRDNQSYPTVQLGSQCWMAANLNFGNSIVSTLYQRDNCISEKYCTNDNPGNCSSYGGMYQWDEVMCYISSGGAQGLCPPGWHIPTEADWNTLFTFYISNGFAGSALKVSGYSGFNAFLSGILFHTVVWRYPVNDPVLRSILFWSSTQRGTNKAWAHGMNEVAMDIEYTPSVSFYPALRSNAFAVRCLKD